jgi:hypothetical protein
MSAIEVLKKMIAVRDTPLKDTFECGRINALKEAVVALEKLALIEKEIKREMVSLRWFKDNADTLENRGDFAKGRMWAYEHILKLIKKRKLVEAIKPLLHCRECGKLLVGEQTRFCSREHFYTNISRGHAGQLSRWGKRKKKEKVSFNKLKGVI